MAGSSVTCWGSGTPLREFLHVDDLGEACVFALEHWDPAAAGAPRAIGPAGEDLGPLVHLNVGTGVELSIRELQHRGGLSLGPRSAAQWLRHLSRQVPQPERPLQLPMAQEATAVQSMPPLVSIPTLCRLAIQPSPFSSRTAPDAPLFSGH